MNKPMVHVFGGAYVIFTLNSLGLSHFLANCLNALNCSCYGLTISLLAVHFIYRYLAVCRPNSMQLFKWPRTIIWIIFCLEIGSEWLITAVLFAGESSEVDNIIRDSMKRDYNLSIGDFVYASSLYYRVEDNGVKRISWPDILFALNIIKLIGICFTIVFYCGIATYRKLRSMRYTSKRTSDLQHQLFKALVVQTLIPMLTMFIPAGIMMISPLFEVALGSFEGMILTIITTYPCLDPIVVIYFVQDYRLVIWNLLRCRKTVFKQNTVSFHATTAGSAIHSN